MQKPLLPPGNASDYHLTSSSSLPPPLPLPTKLKKKSVCWLSIMMICLVIVGCVNFVLVKALYDAFGTRGAFFANQGVNLLYIIYGGMFLGWKVLTTNEIDAEMRSFPQSKFFGLSILDAFGTFFTAMGATFTPLALQQILNQSLIPLCMLFSFFFLKTRFRSLAILGAVLIFAGAAIVVLGSVENNSSSEHFRWYAACIYFLSNVPMALSAVYKEIAFNDQTVDVWYLCFWVSLYQFLISFMFVPLLGIPFISGSAHPPPLSDLPQQLLDGAACWWGSGACCCGGTTNSSSFSLVSYESIGQDHCDLAAGDSVCPTPLGPALWLLPGYTLTNFLYNGLGLYITKHGSAVLRYISYALILPLATMAGASVFHEHITVYTLVGLLTVIVGFGLYQRYHALRKFDAGSVAGESNNDAANDNDRAMEIGGGSGLGYDEGNIGGGPGAGPTMGGGQHLGYLPGSDPDWFRKSLLSERNPFAIGSPKFVQWKKQKVTQVSFQERVIGLGLAHPKPTIIQNTSRRAIRRAAQLYHGAKNQERKTTTTTMTITNGKGKDRVRRLSK